MSHFNGAISLRLVENPSCLQTTCASCSSHSMSQIVPQVLLKHISTLPPYAFVPLMSRTPYVRQGVGGKGVGCGAGWVVCSMIGKEGIVVVLIS